MNDVLKKATTLFKAGDREEAEHLVMAELRRDPNSDQAWVLLARITDDPSRKADCLRRVLSLTEDGRLRNWAQEQLRELEAKAQGPPLPPDIHLDETKPASGLVERPRPRLESDATPMLRRPEIEEDTQPLEKMEELGILDLPEPGFSIADTMVSQRTRPMPMKHPLSPDRSEKKEAEEIPPRRRRIRPLVWPGMVLCLFVVGSLIGLVWLAQTNPEIAALLPFVLEVTETPAPPTFTLVPSPTHIPTDTPSPILTSTPEASPTSTDTPTDISIILSTINETQRLVEPETRPVGIGYGRTVAISGNLLAVGALEEQTGPGGGAKSGAVYVYTLAEDGTWEYQARMAPSDPVDNQRFGEAIVIGEETIVIGASGTAGDDGLEQVGAVYVFELVDDEWMQQDRLVPDVAVETMQFGASLAFHDDVLIVGAPSTLTDNAGGAYVLARGEDGWVVQTRLPLPEEEVIDAPFGSAVAFDGQTLVVGAGSAGQEGGAVVIYQLEGDAWLQRKVVFAPEDDGYTGFGTRLALTDRTVIVGVADSSRKPIGPYLIEDRSGIGDWAQYDTVLLVPPPEATDNIDFGASFAVQGDTLVVGAPLYPRVSAPRRVGAVYVYTRKATGWEPVYILTPANQDIEAAMGIAVGIDGDTVVAGAAGYSDTNDNEPEAVYVFSLVGAPETGADINTKTGIAAALLTSVAVSVIVGVRKDQ